MKLLSRKIYRVVASFIFCAIQLNGFADELYCGTVTDTLDYSIYDEIGAIRSRLQAINAVDTNTLRFRIQIHVIRTDDGYTDLQENLISHEIEDLNYYYKPARIMFYMCNPINYIDESTYYNFHYSDEEGLTMAYTDPNSINIYYAHTASTSSGSVAGYSYYPTNNVYKNIIVVANAYIQQNTLIHEMGHFFNLKHTHDTIAGIEFVDRINCTVAGDLCCDTPADPNLSSKVNSDCEYTGHDVDPRGVFYNPDTRNIMSYSRKLCRNHFSDDQYARIREACYLSSRTPMCSHTSSVTGDIINSITIDDDYVVIKDASITGDLNINICKELIMESNVSILGTVNIQ